MQYADGLVISAKKDIVSDSGGIIAFKDEETAKKYIENIKNPLDRAEVEASLDINNIPLCGRDIARLRAALNEVFDDAQNAYQSQIAQRLFDLLRQAGVPVILDQSGYGVFINATQFFDHLNKTDETSPNLPGRCAVCQRLLPDRIPFLF